MNADRLLALYEQVAEAPDAMPPSASLRAGPRRAGETGAAGRGRRTGVGTC